MPGLYIHIPFCRKACHFCNFHFSTSLRLKERMLEALLTELEVRQDYLPSHHLRSIYLGGGTPSVLSAQDMNRLFDKISGYFEWDENTEITLEANPDDLTIDYLHMLRDSPVNRLSIGLQSLDDAHLEWMNRSHTAEQCVQSVENALRLGFRDMSVDWLYGYHGLSDKALTAQLDWMKELGIPHFSAYSLTVEEGTVLHHRIQKGKESPLKDRLSRDHFDLIMDWVAANGYEHYEISNFSLPGRRAVHNSSYWGGDPYCGIGPSAHSYKENTRRWNVANNAAYMKAMEAREPFFTEENLSKKDRYNEWVMTGLRLKEGLQLDRLQKEFAEYQDHFHSSLQQLAGTYWIRKGNDTISLSREGKHFADRVASELFV